MRRHFLDNIRWATVLLVLVYHVFYLYNSAGVPFPVAQGVLAFDALCYAVYPWFMALLFAVAGASARYALERQPLRAFLRAKRDKLLVPSTLGLFAWHFLTGWVNVASGGMLDQIPVFIRYPLFVISGVGPLWFIQTLYVCSVLLALLVRLGAADRLHAVGGRAGLPALCLLGAAVWLCAQALNVPVVSVYRFGLYGACYLLGYAVLAHDAVQERLVQARRPLLLAAILLGALFIGRWFGQDYTQEACLRHPLTIAYLWMAVLAIFACGKAWADRETALSRRMMRVSFSVYVLHYLPTLLACLALAHTPLPAAARYPLALAFAAIMTAALAAVMPRVPGLRYLVLGIKK